MTSRKNNSWKRAVPLLRLGTEQQNCEVCPGPADTVGPTWTLTQKPRSGAMFCGWCTRGWRSETNTINTVFQKKAPVRGPQLGGKACRDRTRPLSQGVHSKKHPLGLKKNYFFLYFSFYFLSPPQKKR